jgi:hypothetical protein
MLNVHLCIQFDNKTLSKSNFKLIYFIKNDSAISYIVDFKIKPSKFQFLCTIKKGFYRKYAIRWSTLYIYVCSKNVVDVDCQTQRRLKLMIKGDRYWRSVSVLPPL